MAADGEEAHEQLLDTPDLATALESEQFKQFLDHVPFAVAVSELRPVERIVYANIEFERLTGQTAEAVQGKAWSALPRSVAMAGEHQLSDAITGDEDYIGAYSFEHGDTAAAVDAWSNVIQDEDGTPMFRLVALADIRLPRSTEQGDIEQRLRDKDELLVELQHRVKNNLQMITTLVRLEARNLPDNASGERFDRLAGEIESLALLYHSLSEAKPGETVDLGVYLSQVATAVMGAHAPAGIHLNLQVDTWPVSINVAMPTGLVVNELLTNSLKHAFTGRDGGTITLHSLVDDRGCQIVVADDGIGLAEGAKWPKRGHLGALIVQSLLHNAKARLDVQSEAGKGVRVTIFFAKADAEPATMSR